MNGTRAVFSPLYNPQDAHFWVSVALVVFVVILWRAKVPAMVATALDGARAKVRAQLDEAMNLREEAQAMLAQAHAQRLETERAAAEMLAAAEADAARLRVEAERALEEDIARRRQLAEQKIALAESQATADVKAAAAELAAETAETILSARLAGAVSDPLIDQGLTRLAERFA
jgi:F-type H+-transporting ATPase subunit b